MVITRSSVLVKNIMSEQHYNLLLSTSDWLWILTRGGKTFPGAAKLSGRFTPDSSKFGFDSPSWDLCPMGLNFNCFSLPGYNLGNLWGQCWYMWLICLDELHTWQQLRCNYLMTRIITLTMSGIYSGVNKRGATYPPPTLQSGLFGL